jgi:hypothetical protein
MKEPIIEISSPDVGVVTSDTNELIGVIMSDDANSRLKNLLECYYETANESYSFIVICVNNIKDKITVKLEVTNEVTNISSVRQFYITIKDIY